MNIDELTIGQLEQIKSLTSGANDDHPFIIGKMYLIRTVTMYLIGKLEWVGDKELRMSQASWIPDTGRFNEALKTGKLNEVEPMKDDVIIGRGALVDATEWSHAAPRDVK